MRSLVKLIQKTYKMVDPHEGKLVMHNVAFLSSLQAIMYLLPVVVLPYLFRVIGPEKFGLISFAQAFVQYFMILTDYGFSVSATREISLCHNDEARIRDVFSAVMTVKLCMTALSLAVLAAVICFIPRFHNDWVIYVLSFGVVIGNSFFPTWFFQGMEKMKYIANLNIVGEFLFVFLILLFVRRSEDYLMVPLITSFASLTTGFLGQYIALRKFGIAFKLPGMRSIKRQLKAGWNVFISVMAINAYTTTRIFAVGLLTNNTLTGFYSMAEKIANVAQTFPLSSFSQALFPRLSKIFHKNKNKALDMMKHIQTITVRISLICLPVIFVFASPIVRVVCGGNYPEVALSLRLLLVSVLFIASNAFRVQFLLVCGKTETYSRIHITMAAIGLPLIILLIHSFSYVGAAMATVAIEGGTFLITYLTVRKLAYR